jgi:hypothetical protein
VVAHRQLIELGLSRSAIQRRVRNGRLHCLYRGVYAVGHRSVGRHGRWMAAVLACGPAAVLSHRDAAALFGLRPNNRSVIEVTAPRTRRGGAGVQVHRARHPHPEDRAVQDGIPVTSLARTLLDLAEVVNARQLERAFDEADRRGLFDLRALERLRAQSRGRHGLKPLARVIEEKRPEPPMTRSEFENAFLDLCHAHGLPRPSTNLWIAGHEVDAVFQAERVVVELDSYAFHRSREAFETDRERDAAMHIAGYRPLRVTDRMMRRRPARTADTVRSLLSAAAAAR